MLILTQTTDSLQVRLAATVATSQAQCFASFRNTTSSAISPLRNVTNTNNTTAVTLVSSPSASEQRVVDYASVYNADTASVTATVLFNANGTLYELFVATLAPEEKLEYQEGIGFSVIAFNGGVKTATEYGVYTRSVPWTTVVLSTDYTVTSAVANTYEDVTGFTFPIATTGTYWYRISTIMAVAAANRLGSIAINGPTTSYIGQTAYIINGNNTIAYSTTTAYNFPTTAMASATSALTRATIILEGMLTATATGTVQVRASPSNAIANSVIVRAGSTLQYYKVL